MSQNNAGIVRYLFLLFASSLSVNEQQAIAFQSFHSLSCRKYKELSQRSLEEGVNSGIQDRGRDSRGHGKGWAWIL